VEKADNENLKIGCITISAEDVSGGNAASIECSEALALWSDKYFSIGSNTNGEKYDVLSIEKNKVYVEQVRIPKIVCGSEKVDANKSTFVDYSSANFSSIPHISVSWVTENGNIAGDWGTLKVSLKSNNGCTVIAGGIYPKLPQSFDWIAVGY
jgi:hypothetical protein